MRSAGRLYPKRIYAVVVLSISGKAWDPFFEGIIHEDNLFTYTCFLCAERVALLNKPLSQRRIRPSSIMTSHPLPENVVGIFSMRRAGAVHSVPDE